MLNGRIRIDLRGEVEIFRNRKDRVFQSVATRSGYGFWMGLAVGDIDNDGDMDVLSASWYDDTIAWYRNLNGLGRFGSAQVISLSTASARSGFMAVDPRC